jgi:hypothetical protein
MSQIDDADKVILAVCVCLSGWFFVGVRSCTDTAIISSTMLRNATDICQTSNGIDFIEIDDDIIDDRFNFHCNGKLETGWWSYHGPMSTHIQKELTPEKEPE